MPGAEEYGAFVTNERERFVENNRTLVTSTLKAQNVTRLGRGYSALQAFPRRNRDRLAGGRAGDGQRRGHRHE